MEELYEMLKAAKERDSSNFNDALLVVGKFRDLLLQDDLDTMADKAQSLFTEEQLSLLAFCFHIVHDTASDVEYVLQLILFKQKNEAAMRSHLNQEPQDMSRRLIQYRNKVVVIGSKVDVTATAANIIRHHESGGKRSKPIHEDKAIRLAMNLAKVRT